MSQERARACIEKMKTDGAFSARVLGAPDVAARVQLINAAGFACSAEEIDAVSAELSDADLEGIAGGFGNVWMPRGGRLPAGRASVGPVPLRAGCDTIEDCNADGIIR